MGTQRSGMLLAIYARAAASRDAAPASAAAGADASATLLSRFCEPDAPNLCAANVWRMPRHQPRCRRVDSGGRAFCGSARVVPIAKIVRPPSPVQPAVHHADRPRDRCARVRLRGQGRALAAPAGARSGLGLGIRLHRAGAGARTVRVAARRPAPAGVCGRPRGRELRRQRPPWLRCARDKGGQTALAQASAAPRPRALAGRGAAGPAAPANWRRDAGLCAGAAALGGERRTLLLPKFGCSRFFAPAPPRPARAAPARLTPRRVRRPSRRRPSAAWFPCPTP